ncbi:trypsin-like serine peptidase [Tropicibacter oceani]|uniref:Serine protease n=1 Tax=Tropicibacter oceani TaxID=3058420 RepID=A0ABY8QMY9_9RHOB|nr:trypsin-like peptidase domain-containing protein [Tropicibacter oceani]WGW05996.1 trypsin-like peptidase domain-containing protein [Tropicibacter oceani]
MARKPDPDGGTGKAGPGPKSKPKPAPDAGPKAKAKAKPKAKPKPRATPAAPAAHASAAAPETGPAQPLAAPGRVSGKAAILGSDRAEGGLIRLPQIPPPEARSAMTRALETAQSPLRRAILPDLPPVPHDHSQCTVREATHAPQADQLARDVRFARLPDDAAAPLEMRRPDTTRRMLEIVLGQDDRTQVTPTLDYVWRCICKLRITAADGSPWVGTGWLAGPRLVITAGHVVHIANRGGWVSEVEVIPGADGAAAPFGAAVSRRFRTVRGWAEDQSGPHDYGAILLPPEASFGDALGYFGVAALDDVDLGAAALHLSGYPADKPANTQWHHARSVGWTEPELLFYDIDTAGGQSGSPVWTVRDGVHYAVGVHRAGEATGNSAVRLTDPSYDNILAWNDEA